MSTEVQRVPQASAAAGAIWHVAVIGNPNTGKTTLFNSLTGLRQRVGNYPGVTVERKTGTCRLDEQVQIELVDLPGTYSLAARSPDEIIAVDVLLGQQQGALKPDAILAVVDASNPERNFYLVSQLCELGLPLVLALNMIDIAEGRQISIDAARLAQALGVPVVPVCAAKGRGLDELRRVLKQSLERKQIPTGRPQFSAAWRSEVESLTAELKPHAVSLGREIDAREAFRILIDKDGFAEKRLVDKLGAGFRGALETRRQRLSPNSLTAEEVRTRYAWVKQTLAEAIRRPAQSPPDRSDGMDRVLTHWFSGTLIFVLLMALVFQSIFTWTEPLMGAVDTLFQSAGALVGENLQPGPLRSLLCDGVIAGLGGVLIFLPQICVLFLFIALLEDCGYMARAAFLMDRLFSPLGLSGKAFIPMLSSFACGVPGVMATRTIEDPRERLITILIAPLMSCSARLPIYYLLIKTFVPETLYLGGWLSLQGLVLLAMYALGIVVAVPVAWLLKRLLFENAGSSFLIELPTYQLPDWRTVLLRIFGRGKEFLVRAGTIILAVNIIVWALAYFPHSAEIGAKFDAQRATLTAQIHEPESLNEQLEALEREESGEYLRQSYFGSMGRSLECVFRPLGWDWRISMGALASFPAREVIVSTMATIFNVEAGDDAQESDSMRAAMRQATWEGTDRKLFTLPVAFSIMIFFALCSQCGATLAVIKRETNSWRWPLFSFAYMTALAYLGAMLAYQAMTAAGW